MTTNRILQILFGH